MQIDGVRVVLLQDSKQAPPIEIKEALGFDIGSQGALTVVGKVNERMPDGKLQDVPIQLKVYAPGTWHHVELMNPQGEKLIIQPAIALPQKGKMQA